MFAYVMTRDWAEFLGIRQDILLRIMVLVEQAGAAFAFPSRTLYLGSDRGPDERKALEAEARVREWRDEGSLPFPNFSPEQAGQIRGSIVYPPPVPRNLLPPDQRRKRVRQRIPRRQTISPMTVQGPSGRNRT